MLVWSTVCVCLLDFYMSLTNKFGIVWGVITLRTNESLNVSSAKCGERDRRRYRLLSVVSVIDEGIVC